MVTQQANRRIYTTTEGTSIVDFVGRDGMTEVLTELLNAGVQTLIASAVGAELPSHVAQFSDLRTKAGHAAVLRNGHQNKTTAQFRRDIIDSRAMAA